MNYYTGGADNSRYASIQFRLAAKEDYDITNIVRRGKCGNETKISNGPHELDYGDGKTVQYTYVYSMYTDIVSFNKTITELYGFGEWFRGHIRWMFSDPVGDVCFVSVSFSWNLPQNAYWPDDVE